MKTLIQVNIEPRVGMVVEALKGKYKHHIIEFGDRFWNYDKVTHKPIYRTHVHTICETGTTSWIEYNHFINNYSFVRCQITGLMICLSQTILILTGFLR